MSIERPRAITKILRSNDTGEAGGHQAGMLIPRGGDVLLFFPDLGNDVLNPRTTMEFLDENGETLKCNFIYYNNKFHHEPGEKHKTRNEYRLTCMTAYFRKNGLKAGDSIILEHDPDGVDRIKFQRVKHGTVEKLKTEGEVQRVKITTGSAWRVIDI